MRTRLLLLAAMALATPSLAADSTNYSGAQRVQGTGDPNRGDPVNTRLVTCSGGTCSEYIAGGGGGGGSTTTKATAAAPTQIEGSTTNPLSTTLAGDLRTVAKQSCLVVTGDQAYTLGSLQNCTMTATGRLKVGLSSATPIAPTAPAAGNNADVVGCVYRSGGATFTDTYIGAVACSASGRLLTDGTGVTQPISASALPLPTGAATETTLGTLATAQSTASTSLGLPADAVCGTGSGTCSLIGLIKYLNTTTTPTFLATSGGTALTTGLSSDGSSATSTAIVIEARTKNFNGSTWDRQRGDVNGAINQPFAVAGSRWTYATAAGATITNSTTAVTLVGASVGIRNYLTGLQIQTDTLTTASDIVIRDGSATVLWRGRLQAASGAMNIQFAVPLRASAVNSLIEVITPTATGAALGIYVDAQGFQSAL